MTKTFVAFSGFCLGAGLLFAGSPTADYKDTRIEAKLNVTVEKGTDVVHFIRDNNDASVYTKVYVLKHADPYELRGYLRNIVQAKKINTNRTGVQAIRYTDGTGMLIVSAEDYRFTDAMNGQSLDELIAALDKPGFQAASGRPDYVYYPKYRSALELMNMLRLVGSNVVEDETENIGGYDRFETDSDLNLIFFNTTNFSRKNISDVLKKYDVPYSEVRTKITVYELYAENDAKLGFDFQAWKNNDGLDLFHAGGRFMRNFQPSGNALAKNSGWNDTQYLQFSPKWNTRYIDFLTSKGKAKVLHSCELTARSGKTARISRTTGAFVTDVKKAADGSNAISGVISLEGKRPGIDFTLTALTGSGKAITINAAGAVDLTVTQMVSATNQEKYILRIKNGNFVINGQNAGTKVNAATAIVSDNGRELAFDRNTPYAAAKGNIVDTRSEEFGFNLAITPAVSEKATILHVEVNNSSLIGYNADGSARIQKGAAVNGSFMISNGGTRLVIGGIEKRDVVSVSGGIPLLKDLPFLGWLFSTEGESTKRSQLVVVAEVVPVRLDSKIPAAAAEKIRKVENKTQKAGIENSYGFRQFLLDPERKFNASDILK